MMSINDCNYIKLILQCQTDPKMKPNRMKSFVDKVTNAMTGS